MCGDPFKNLPTESLSPDYSASGFTKISLVGFNKVRTKWWKISRHRTGDLSFDRVIQGAFNHCSSISKFDCTNLIGYLIKMSF